MVGGEGYKQAGGGSTLEAAGAVQQAHWMCSSAIGCKCCWVKTHSACKPQLLALT